MANFNQTMNPCSFGFYTHDPLFQFDADRMVTFVLRSLGEDILGVEITKKMVWNEFERATRAFEGQIIEYQATSNLASLLGINTGSFDPNNLLNPNNINVTNLYVKNNLDFIERMAEAYSSHIGLGGTTDTLSGSISLIPGVQDYDLYNDLVNDAGVPLAAMMPTGSRGKLNIYEVFHASPSAQVYNGTLTSNFVGVGASAGSSVGGAMFHVLPVFEDVLRGAMMKTAQRVRRSHYSYKITGKHIRVFPMPTNILPTQNKLWIRCGFGTGALPTMIETLSVSGTMNPPANPQFALIDDALYGASNPANVPFGFIAYKSLNPWARNWIAEYTLALCKEVLGLVRTKYDTIPLPGAEVKLNGDTLLTQGREDKEKLLTALKERLDSLSLDKIAEREAAKAESMVKQLSYIPIPASWTIRLA